MKFICKTQGSTSALRVLLAFLGTRLICAQAAKPHPNRVRTIITSRLPPHMVGDSLRATLISVQYGPGEASPSHTHACPVIVYVLEGKVRSKIGGQPEVVYNAGESFYEPPGRLHAVSANASKDKPSRFLAFFVCDRDTPLSSDVPIPPSESGHD